MSIKLMTANQKIEIEYRKDGELWSGGERINDILHSAQMRRWWKEESFKVQEVGVLDELWVWGVRNGVQSSWVWRVRRGNREQGLIKETNKKSPSRVHQLKKETSRESGRLKVAVLRRGATPDDVGRRQITRKKSASQTEWRRRRDGQMKNRVVRESSEWVQQYFLEEKVSPSVEYSRKQQAQKTDKEGNSRDIELLWKRLTV